MMGKINKGSRSWLIYLPGPAIYSPQAELLHHIELEDNNRRLAGHHPGATQERKVFTMNNGPWSIPATHVAGTQFKGKML